MSKSPTIPVTAEDLTILLEELEGGYTLVDVSLRRRRYGGPTPVLTMEVSCLDTLPHRQNPRIVLDAVLPVSQAVDFGLVAYRLLWAALDRAILVGALPEALGEERVPA